MSLVTGIYCIYMCVCVIWSMLSATSTNAVLLALFKSNPYISKLK